MWSRVMKSRQEWLFHDRAQKNREAAVGFPVGWFE
jgi:hypothetical protein